MHPTYMGMRIVLNDILDEYESVPKRHHKRKRIQKKWNKRFGFYSRFVKSDALVFENDSLIIMSTRNYTALRKQLDTINPVSKERLTDPIPPKMGNHPSDNLKFLTTNYFPTITKLFNPVSA